MIIRVRGARRAGAYVAGLVTRLGRAYPVTVKESLDDLEAVARKYPPESEANRPKYGSYGPFYIRGEGSAYMSQNGQVRIYPTSEQLGDSWVRRIVTRVNNIVGRVGPRASYGPFVVGSQQAPYHTRRKWPTLAGTVRAGFAGVVKKFVVTTVRVVRRG